MLRRKASATSNGETGHGIISATKFKVPSFLNKRPTSALPPRKKAKVSYRNAGGNKDDDSDDDGRPKKKVKVDPKLAINQAKEVDDDGVPLGELNIIKKFPTFEKREKETVFKQPFKVPAITTASGQVVRTPTSNVSLGLRRQPLILPRPLHDPLADHAIVLFDPTIDVSETEEERAERVKEEEAAKLEEMRRKAAGDKPNPHKSLAVILGLDKKDKKTMQRVKVPVVIEPRLAKVLRPHQVEGVKFLYRCTTGLLAPDAFGCIMADEMGLGKTLQCIALLQTLLRQSPFAGKPTIEKAIIVCPSSLVKNWGNELVKWLGEGVINPLSVDGKGGKEVLIPAVRRWVAARGRNVTQQVMIVSYETLRLLDKELASCEVGLLLADEGHRLKNSESLTYTSLNGLKCKRRVILTGTPVQNDLTEYFALLNFVNPSYLGTRQEFRKNFELSILKGRDVDATERDRATSDAKLKELGLLVNKFIIRRTNDLLSKYLPVKYETVVFCGLSDFQLALYRHFITSPVIKKLLKGVGSQPLKAINILKKLCNHPDLLQLPEDLEGCEGLFPDGYLKTKSRRVETALGGKFIVLERFLHRLRTETTDKIVLISNYTQTLDLFQSMCRNNKYPCLRLDGSMAINKRQKIVDQFNDPEGNQFVFLLSSKAGGCGINLIGANRLILFDPDWNPAADQQALARVWRDGQKKECFVYRFISTGTIEEKVFQRQAHKQSLSSCVVDDNADTTERHFSLTDLRELFLFNDKTTCDTHDSFKCKRCKGGKQVAKAPAFLYGDTSTWNHITNAELGQMHDDCLRAELGQDQVSMVFQYISC